MTGILIFGSAYALEISPTGDQTQPTGTGVLVDDFEANVDEQQALIDSHETDYGEISTEDIDAVAASTGPIPAGTYSIASLASDNGFSVNGQLINSTSGGQLVVGQNSDFQVTFPGGVNRPPIVIRPNSLQGVTYNGQTANNMTLAEGTYSDPFGNMRPSYAVTLTFPTANGGTTTKVLHFLRPRTRASTDIESEASLDPVVGPVYVPVTSPDSDGDGIADSEDPDADGDGVTDFEDLNVSTF